MLLKKESIPLPTPLLDKETNSFLRKAYAEGGLQQQQQQFSRNKEKNLKN